MESSDIHWLVSDPGEKYLALVRQDERPLHAILQSLRRDLSAERAHLVLQQQELRKRAAVKFTLAEKMFFTEKGLQQATDEIVARSKAERFAAGEPAADLCCGIGGDLCGIAERGPTFGVDQDEPTAIFAQANLRAAISARNEAGAEPHAAIKKERAPHGVRNGAIEGDDVHQVAAWHIDPDRRAKGGRVSQVAHYEPSAAEIIRLLEINPNAAVKLAPAAVAPADWREQAELEWISRGGECRQQVAWFGSLAAQPGARIATVIRKDGAARTTFHGEADLPLACAERVLKYVYEPDAAVMAARLTGAVARRHQLLALETGGAYLTGDQPLEHGALAGFAVLEVLPLDIKTLRGWLAARGLGRLEIKKRNVPIEPAALMRQLRNPGDGAVTLLVGRTGGKTVVIAAQRLSPPADFDKRSSS